MTNVHLTNNAWVNYNFWNFQLIKMWSWIAVTLEVKIIIHAKLTNQSVDLSTNWTIFTTILSLFHNLWQLEKSHFSINVFVDILYTVYMNLCLNVIYSLWQLRKSGYFFPQFFRHFMYIICVVQEYMLLLFLCYHSVHDCIRACQ